MLVTSDSRILLMIVQSIDIVQRLLADLGGAVDLDLFNISCRSSPKKLLVLGDVLMI